MVRKKHRYISYKYLQVLIISLKSLNFTARFNPQRGRFVTSLG
jgi:hypothetical protein